MGATTVKAQQGRQSGEQTQENVGGICASQVKLKADRLLVKRRCQSMAQTHTAECHGVSKHLVRNSGQVVSAVLEHLIREGVDRELGAGLVKRHAYIILKWLWDEADQKMALTHEVAGVSVTNKYSVLVQRGTLRFPHDILNRTLLCPLQVLQTSQTSCLSVGLLNCLPFDARESWATEAAEKYVWFFAQTVLPRTGDGQLGSFLKEQQIYSSPIAHVMPTKCI